MKWILIIILHGWGAGAGSNGNAVSGIEFSTQLTCENAAAKVMNDGETTHHTQAICVLK